MTHHQDISFLKSKSVAHCKIHVFIVSNGGRLCLLQPESGDHCDLGAQGNTVTAPGHCTGVHPLVSTNQSPVSDTVDQSEARAGLLSHHRSKVTMGHYVTLWTSDSH